MSIREIDKFVGSTYTGRWEAHLDIKSGTNPTTPMPTARTEGDPYVIQLILQTEVKALVTQKV